MFLPQGILKHSTKSTDLYANGKIVGRRGTELVLGTGLMTEFHIVLNGWPIMKDMLMQAEGFNL